MKFTNKFKGHHGDVQIFSIESLPTNAKKLDKNTFIAKSEKSGHCHVLCGEYEMYEMEDGGFCVNVKGELAVMNHTKYDNVTAATISTPKETSIADHKPISIPSGLYYVGIQRRINPFQKVWENVQD